MAQLHDRYMMMMMMMMMTIYYICLILLFIVDMYQEGRNENRPQFKTATLTLYKDHSDNADIKQEVNVTQ